MRLKFQNIKIERADNISEAFTIIEKQFSVFCENLSNQYKPVALNIFCDYSDRSEFLSLSTMADKLFSNIFGQVIISIIGETPADGKIASAELMLASKGNSDIQVSEQNNKPIEISIEYPQGKLLFFKPFQSAKVTNNVFKELDLISGKSCGLSNIVRAWHYVPDIIGFSDIDGYKKQNYQLVNEQREDVYSSAEWNHGYPAATGIGQVKGNYMVHAIGFVPKDKSRIIKISNPLQTDPARYSDNVIISGKKTPKFERAKLVLTNDSGLFFISGTASISGEQTLYIDDPKGQTLKTIENIYALIKKVSLDYNIGPESFSDSHYRVYIKNKRDFSNVKNICESKIGSNSINYVIADICRDNLLVEIEAYFNISGNFVEFL